MGIEREPQIDALGGRALVTGCAGFIGSHLCERLLDSGWEVTGVDSFTPFYDRALKERNLARLRDEPAFDLRELDLTADSLTGLAEGVDAVFHLAGQPGARQSFGAGAAACERNNVLATARLVEEATARPPGVFLFASSSTTYGDAATVPTPETAPLRPVSPYGASKVAAEQLTAGCAEAGVRSVILRYFSCYGPRQRPDMALSRFIAGIIAREPLPIYGDGRQLRDFTFVDDVVRATVLAAARAPAGSTLNIGGGESVALLEAVELLGELIGAVPELELRRPAPGDARRTGADVTRAAAEIGFSAECSLAEGLAAQVEWTLEDVALAAGTS
jgi:nucleoside-diphosphate-sugar epimerase